MLTVAVGIIGMGYAGFRHLSAVRSVAGVRVTAVADSVAIDAAKVGEGVTIHRDWERMLDPRKSPSINAVIICSPHHLHAPMVERALQAGVHVLLEKPLAATIEDARRIAELSQRCGQRVMMGMTHRFYPPMREARELVRSGRLGKIVAVEDRIVEPISPRVTGWLLTRAMAGGGVALTNGIHMLDRLAWLTGQELTFHSGAAGWTQGLGDIEDTATMQLTLADGTPVTLLASWIKREGELDDELTVYGTGGTLRVWSWRGWQFEPAGLPVERHEPYRSADDFSERVRIGMKAQMDCFASVIGGEATDCPSPSQVLARQEIINQFYQSLPAKT